MRLACADWGAVSSPGTPPFLLTTAWDRCVSQNFGFASGFFFVWVYYSLTREPFSYIAKNCVKAKAFSANQFGVSKITTKGQNGGLQYIDQCSYSKDAICVRYSLLNICHNRSNLRNTQNQGSSIHCISTRAKEENLLGSHLIVTLPHGGEVTAQPGNKDCWDQGEGNLRGKHEKEEPEEIKECKPG